MIIHKRGMTNNILGIIIAVIGIIGLIFLGVKIYKGFVKLDEQNAQEFIDSLKGKIDLLSDGENNTFFMKGIEKWFLVAYNRDKNKPVNENSRPQKCFLNDYCLCICEKSPKVEDCQERGFCRKMDKPVNMELTFIAPWSDYNTGAEGTEIYNLACIPFYKNALRSFFISKSTSIFINTSLPEMFLENDQDFLKTIVKELNSCKIITSERLITKSGGVVPLPR